MSFQEKKPSLFLKYVSRMSCQILGFLKTKDGTMYKILQNSLVLLYFQFSYSFTELFWEGLHHAVAQYSVWNIPVPGRKQNFDWLITPTYLHTHGTYWIPQFLNILVCLCYRICTFFFFIFLNNEHKNDILWIMRMSNY